MEKIEGLSIGLGLDTLKLDSGLTDLKSKLKLVNSVMKANLSAFDYGDKSIGKYETRLQGLNKKLEVQKVVTEKAKKSYEKMVKEHGEGSKEADNAAKSYNNEVASLNNLERYVASVSDELKKLKDEQRIAESGWTKFGQTLEKTGSKLTGIGNGIKSAGKSMSLYITAPIAGLAGALVKTGVGYKAFKQESQKAFSVLLGSSEAAEKHMEKIMDFAKTTPFAFPDLVSANRKLVSFGMKAEATGPVMEAIANSVAAMGGSGQDIEDMADIFAKITSNGKITGDELNRLGDRGVNALQILANQAGMSMEEMRKQISSGAIDSEKSIGWLVDGMMNGTDGVNGATVVMGGSLESLDGTWKGALDSMKGAWRRAGDSIVSDKLFENMTGAVNKVTDVIGKLPDLISPIADGIGNIFIWIIDKTSLLVDGFFKMDKSIQQGIVNFGALLVILGPLLLVGGGLIAFLGNVATGLGKLMPSIAKAGGLLKWLRSGLVVLTGPVGIVIGVLTLLGVGFILLYKNSETFRNGVHKLLGVIKDLAQKALKAIKPAIEAVITFFKDQLDHLKKFWNENGQVIMDALSNIGKIIKVVFQVIVKVIQFAMPLVLGIIKSVWGNIKGVISGALNVIMGLVKVFSGLFTGNFRKVWEGIKQVFSGALTFIWNFVQLMFWGKMLKGILSLGKLLVNSFKGMWTSIKSVFSKVIKWILDFVKNRFTAMKNTVNTIIKTIKNLISTIWDGILNFFKLVIKSIVDFVKSRFTNLKNNINTIFSGIRNLTKTIWNAIKDSIYTPIKNAVTKTISRFTNLKSRISDIFGTIKKSVKGYISDMVETVKGMPQKMSDGLKKTGSKIKEGVISVANKMVSGLGSGVNGVITGVNWVLGKVGVKKKNQLDPWKVPQYAQGTDGHPGGLAVVGDGKGSNAGQELIQTPDGQQYLSPSKSTLVNLPQGTHILAASLTKQLIPHYAWGDDFWSASKSIASTAWDATKKGAKKVKDTGVDIWQFASNPSKLLDLGMKFLGITAPSGDSTFDKIAKGGFTKVKNSAVDFVKEKMKELFGEGGSTAPVGSGVERWRSVILKAAAMMKESVTSAEVNGILAQIKRESGGNEKIVQSSAVWDVNTAAGNPARGLLQYIPQTFNAYKMKGHNKIYSGFDQLLAFFNNSTWRRDLPYGRRGWGPRGKRKYKNGTGLLGHIGGDAILGDGGKVEPFLMPNGLLGLSPDSATLFPNLPKGTMVWPSIQDLLKEYAESQAAAFTISTNATNRTDAMKLLALAGKTVDKGNNRPGQSPNVGSSSEGNNVLQKLLEATLEQTQVLLQLLRKDTDIILDGPSLAKGIHKEVTKYQTQDKRISKRTIKGKVRK